MTTLKTFTLTFVHNHVRQMIEVLAKHREDAIRVSMLKMLELSPNQDRKGAARILRIEEGAIHQVLTT